METLEKKVDRLRSIASSLGLHGETVEALVQMLGYALHTSEVEHIAYSQEATLERATNINSKIQHCVNFMYSVYRGYNPTVIISFNPQKKLIYNPGDLVAKSNTYNIYYLAYWEPETSEFIYSGTTLYPGINSEKTILCLLSTTELEDSWTIDTGNLYYRNIKTPKEEKLSSNYFLSLSEDGKKYNQVQVTRHFSEHEKDNLFFDLTLPGMGMRIYYPETYKEIILGRNGYSGKSMKIRVFPYLRLEDINPNELKMLKIPGCVPVNTPEEISMIYDSPEYKYDNLIFIKESGVDTMESIHYLANKSRFAGTYTSTNQDLSYMLSETFPEKIRQTDGVSYIFDRENNELSLYYVPSDSSMSLTKSDIDTFIEKNSSYYVTNNIKIQRGISYNADIILYLELYSNNSLQERVMEILKSYEYRFGINLGNENNRTPLYQEAISLITKLSEVKYVSDMKIKYYKTEDGITKEVSLENIDPKISYFYVTCEINSNVL